jgi:hypothetical protein
MQGAAIYFQAKGVLNPPRARSSTQLKIYASAAHMQYKSKKLFLHGGTTRLVSSALYRTLWHEITSF